MGVPPEDGLAEGGLGAGGFKAGDVVMVGTAVPPVESPKANWLVVRSPASEANTNVTACTVESRRNSSWPLVSADGVS